MIAGHFGLVAGVKSQATDVPLWSLMLGSVWLDVVFVPLFAAGVETIEPVPGTAGGYGNGIIHADWTHSFVGALVLSAIYGLAFLPRWGRRAAWILAAMAFSHWLLDLVVHRGDMPLLPGNAGGLPTLGFGLWRWPLVAAAVELALILVGGLFYWRAARDVVAFSGGPGRGRADLAAALVVIFGLVTLGLDLSGFAG
jgi:hypothetical protein